MNRFENGFHSFKKSIMCLTQNSIDEFDLKEIIINFHHSVEVLFKHILFNKHSLFIYNDIDKLFERNFNMKLRIGKSKEENNIEPFTITFDEAIKRVIVICEETIDEYTYNRLKSLNKFRNSLTHDELDLIKEKVEQLIISVLPTVIMILRKHLPEENKKEFIEFIDDKEIETKLTYLYTYNDKWKVITVINLLTTYKSIDDGEISIRDKNHMNKMISLLGCEINEDDMFTIIDEKYYLSVISYLKQEICDHIVFYTERMKEYIKDDEMNKLLYKNEIIADICKQYVYNMVCYLTELINIDKNELNQLIGNKKSINSFFDNTLLINNVDIYEILFYIRKTAESYAEICDNKMRRDVFLKGIYLYDDKSVSAYDIYSLLINWFKDKKWYNNTNFKDIPKEIMNIFQKDKHLDAEIIDEVDDAMYDGNFFNDLIGEFGECSSIDYVAEHYIEGINIIIKDIDKSNYYILILDVSIEVKTYTDGDCYNNGTVEAYVAVSGQVTQDKKFSIEGIKYLGRRIIVDSFGFR